MSFKSAANYAASYLNGQNARGPKALNPLIPWSELAKSGQSARLRILFPETRKFLGGMPGISFATYFINGLRNPAPVEKGQAAAGPVSASALAPSYFGLPDVIGDAYHALPRGDERAKRYQYATKYHFPVYWYDPPTGIPRLAIACLTRKDVLEHIIGNIGRIKKHRNDMRDDFIALTSLESGYSFIVSPTGDGKSRSYAINMDTAPEPLNLSEEQTARLHTQLAELDLKTRLTVWHPTIQAEILRGEYDWRGATQVSESVQSLLPSVRCASANPDSSDPFVKYQPWPSDAAFEDIEAARSYLERHNYQIAQARDAFVAETGMYAFTRAELEGLCDMRVYGAAYTEVTGNELATSDHAASPTASDAPEVDEGGGDIPF